MYLIVWYRPGTERIRYAHTVWPYATILLIEEVGGHIINLERI